MLLDEDGRQTPITKYSDSGFPTFVFNSSEEVKDWLDKRIEERFGEPDVVV